MPSCRWWSSCPLPRMPVASLCGCCPVLQCSIERGGCHLVSRFADRDYVVTALRPVDVLHRDPVLLRQVLECLRPLESILRVANALVREVGKSNVGRHGASSLALCRGIFPLVLVRGGRRSQLAGSELLDRLINDVQEPTKHHPCEDLLSSELGRKP